MRKTFNRVREKINSNKMKMQPKKLNLNKETISKLNKVSSTESVQGGSWTILVVVAVDLALDMIFAQNAQ